MKLQAQAERRGQMFVEFPKTSANKISLCIYPSACKLRVYRGGYVVGLFTLWDRCKTPLIQWGRKKWGQSLRVP